MNHIGWNIPLLLVFVDYHTLQKTIVHRWNWLYSFHLYLRFNKKVHTRLNSLTLEPKWIDSELHFKSFIVRPYVPKSKSIENWSWSFIAPSGDKMSGFWETPFCGFVYKIKIDSGLYSELGINGPRVVDNRTPFRSIRTVRWSLLWIKSGCSRNWRR